MNSLRIEWDRSYGIEKRRGWTIVVDGMVVARGWGSETYGRHHGDPGGP